MFTGPVEDRLAIRELNETYGDGVLRFDAETWGSTWAEDAVWDFMGMELKGRSAIVETWLSAMQGFEAVSFSCVPASIEIEGDRATSRVHTQEILKAKDGTTRMVGGAYRDELERRDGRWVFTKRTFAVVAEYQPGGE